MLKSQINLKAEEYLIDFWNISFSNETPSIGWQEYAELKQKIERLL